MTTPTLTVEKIIEHHLSQNTGQKLTPHLMIGLITLLAQNLRTAGFIVEPVKETS